jgi:hypothetical protein
MTTENSTVSAPETSPTEKYTFETEDQIYEIDAHSDKGREFQALSTGPEKIKFLQQNGRKTTKELGREQRIMLARKGAWRFYNVGQLEYMFRADNDDDSESPLEKQFKELKGIDERKEFFLMNVTRIREWPERIQRVENLVEVVSV